MSAFPQISEVPKEEGVAYTTKQQQTIQDLKNNGAWFFTNPKRDSMPETNISDQKYDILLNTPQTAKKNTFEQIRENSEKIMDISPENDK